MQKMNRRSFSLFVVGLVGSLAGCDSEDKLAGTPTNLPPNTMPPAPPLTQTPADLAKSGKRGSKKASKPPAS